MKKFLNKKRKASLASYSYELSKLIIAGVTIVGIMNNGKLFEIIWGIILSIAFFVFGFVIESEDEEDHE